MPTKVKRSLYIGLGGTGMKALLQAKKRFIDTYGEVPPMVSFLGFDADRNEFDKTLKSARGELVEFEPADRMGLYADGAMMFYENNPKSFNWMPSSNVSFLDNLTHYGAGAIRTNGHFALTINVDNVECEITKRLQQIANAAIINDPNYVIDGGVPEIHIVFSVCGGTGAGTFIHMAYLTRQIAAANGIPNIKIRGYAVLPGIFEGVPVTPRVKPNAYKSLCDLDYLMHLDASTPAYQVNYLNGRIDNYFGRPFDSVLLIDNRGAVGTFNLDKVEDLSEMIGIALATSAGTLDAAGASIGDNQTQLIISKAMNIDNKLGWVGGMAACEIIYSGSTLADIYKLKAQSHVIDRLFNSCEDANNIANGWIDSADVRIRENNGENQLTDYVHALAPDYPFSVNSHNAPEAEIKSNKALNVISEGDLQKKIDSKVEEVTRELRRLLVTNINRECGLNLSQEILTQIRAQIAICVNEMRDEKEKLEKELKAKDGYIDASVVSYKEIMKKWFRSDEKTACTDALNNAVNDYNTTAIDIQRHSAAISIYHSILDVLNKKEAKLAAIEKALRTIKTNIIGKVAQLQNGASGVNPILQIDLAADDYKKVNVKYDEVNLNDFIRSFSKEVNLLDFDQLSTSSIEEYLAKYTATLATAKSYEEKSVENVLAALKENNIDAFNRIIAMANAKVDIMLSYSHAGHKLPMLAPRIMYLGLESSKSCLNDPNVFAAFNQGAKPFEQSSITVVTTNMKERVMLYRQVGVFPLFMVPSLKTYETALKALSKSITAFQNDHGFDVDMLLGRRMKEDMYSLDPVPPTPVADSLDLWVRGIVYGRIKNENGCYYIKSETLGTYSEDFWIKLKEWRHDSFKEFEQRIEEFAEDFQKYFRETEAKEGSEATKKRFEDARANYHEVSQIKVSLPTLKTRPYVDVKKLFDREGKYLKSL